MIKIKCKYCNIDESETRIINSPKYGNVCRKHYLQLSKHGKIINKTIYDKNEYEIHGDYTIIYTYDKQGNRLYDKNVIIDTCKLNMVKDYRIGATKTYPRIQIGNKRMFLHNYLFPELGMIDHINRNKYDDRECNLRRTDYRNNAYNVDKGLYKGVKQVPSGRYQASIMVNYKSIYLGTFDTKEEALYNRYLADLKYCPDTRDKKYDKEKQKIFDKFKFNY